MVDDPGKEPLADNTNDQHDPPHEIIPVEDPETITTIQQTANMEVHHHAHPGHHKKKWTDYFWEFLMLFLAVFCGFLAEYQLEHKIERDREKKFIQTFIEDLKTDTAAIKANLFFQKRKKAQLDSLIYLLSEQKIRGNESELYYLGRILVKTTRF